MQEDQPGDQHIIDRLQVVRKRGAPRPRYSDAPAAQPTKLSRINSPVTMAKIMLANTYSGVGYPAVVQQQIQRGAPSGAAGPPETHADKQVLKFRSLSSGSGEGAVCIAGCTASSPPHWSHGSVGSAGSILDNAPAQSAPSCHVHAAPLGPHAGLGAATGVAATSAHVRIEQSMQYQQQNVSVHPDPPGTSANGAVQMYMHMQQQQQQSQNLLQQDPYPLAHASAVPSCSAVAFPAPSQAAHSVCGTSQKADVELKAVHSNSGGPATGAPQQVYLAPTSWTHSGSEGNTQRVYVTQGPIQTHGSLPAGSNLIRIQMPQPQGQQLQQFRLVQQPGQQVQTTQVVQGPQQQQEQGPQLVQYQPLQAQYQGQSHGTLPSQSQCQPQVQYHRVSHQPVQTVYLSEPPKHAQGQVQYVANSVQGHFGVSLMPVSGMCAQPSAQAAAPVAPSQALRYVLVSETQQPMPLAHAPPASDERVSVSAPDSTKYTVSLSQLQAAGVQLPGTVPAAGSGQPVRLQLVMHPAAPQAVQQPAQHQVVQQIQQTGSSQQVQYIQAAGPQVQYIQHSAPAQVQQVMHVQHAHAPGQPQPQQPMLVYAVGDGVGPCQLLQAGRYVTAQQQSQPPQQQHAQQPPESSAQAQRDSPIVYDI